MWVIPFSCCTVSPSGWLDSRVVEHSTCDSMVAGFKSWPCCVVGQQPWASCSHPYCLAGGSVLVMTYLAAMCETIICTLLATATVIRSLLGTGCGTESQTKLVWRLASTLHSVCIKWTGWTVAVALSHDDSTITIIVVITVIHIHVWKATVTYL